jgi:WD40 repeat protein
MSPDGGMVVAGGVTGALTVWNAEDGEHIATLKSGHSSAVVACSWGANDQLCSVEKVCCAPASAHLFARRDVRFRPAPRAACK